MDTILRLKILISFMALVSLLLLSRVFYLSIKSNSYYEELSKQNYIKRIYSVEQRGAIFDTNGKLLAKNDLGFTLKIKPHLSRKKHKEELDRLLILINKYFPKYSIKKMLRSYHQKDSPYNHTFIEVIEYIKYNDFMKNYVLFSIQDNIEIELSVKRHYPFKDIAAHVIGYTGETSAKDIKKNKNLKYFDFQGRSGLERFYNEKLQGEIGYKDVKVNALYEEVQILNEKKSVSSDINITLDIELQEYVHNLFTDLSGVVIVMKADTGEILTAGSFPEFDNNIFVQGVSVKKWNDIINNFNHPFTNKIANGLYPPASVIKMGTAISFLENKVSKYFNVDCNGSIKLGKRQFRCWKRQGHGKTSLKKALRESCDDFFYKGSLKVGINNISKTLEKFGFGQKTGIDQPNEFIGVNPNKRWKKKRHNIPWYIGETLISSIGQGYILVTPIQVARYTAGLATGKLPRPHFLKDKSLIQNIDINVTKDKLKLVRLGMHDVVHNKKGTAFKYIKMSNLDVAAKTGTAQVIGIPQSEKKRMQEHELEFYHRSHAWLTSYAPYKNPKYVVTVIIEHGGHGGHAAGKIVENIYRKMISLGYLK